MSKPKFKPKTRAILPPNKTHKDKSKYDRKQDKEKVAKHIEDGIEDNEYQYNPFHDDDDIDWWGFEDNDPKLKPNLNLQNKVDNYGMKLIDLKEQD